MENWITVSNIAPFRGTRESLKREIIIMATKYDHPFRHDAECVEGDDGKIRVRDKTTGKFLPKEEGSLGYFYPDDDYHDYYNE